MARSRIMEMAIELQGRMNSSLRNAFGGASSQMQRLEQRTRQLRENQRALNEAYSRGEISLRDYQERLRQLQGQLDRTTAAQRRLQDLQNRRADIQGQNDGLSSSAASTAAMAAPIVGATIAAASYADSQKRIQVQSNLTAQQSETAWEVVRQAHLSGLGEGIQETSYAYGLMSQIIKGETAEQQKAILQGSLALEKYWQQDTAEVSKAVQNLTSNIKGLSKTEAMDIITAGFQNGLNYADDYIDTLSEYAPQLDDLGFSAKQFYGVLQAGKNAGAFNLDKVGDALKEFRILATEETSADAYRMLGFDPAQIAQQVSVGGDTALGALDSVIKKLRDVSDPAQQEMAGRSIFGTMWEDLTKDVILSMNVLEGVGAEIDGASKKVVDAATDANKGSVSWLQLARSIQDTGAAVGQSFLPVVAPLIQGLNSGAQATANFAEENPGLTRAIIIGTSALIGLRMATLGARFGWNQLRLMGTDLRLVNERLRISQILTAASTRVMTIAQRGLNLAMRMNPIGLVVTSIAALAAGFKLAYDKVEWFRKAVDKAWAALKKLLGLNNKDESSGSVGNLRLLDTYATGGFANRPSIFGDAGLEAAIPIDGSARSRSIWERAGELSGFSSGDSITYAPIIHAPGGDPAVIKQVLDESRDDFFARYQALKHQQRRVAYG